MQSNTRLKNINNDDTFNEHYVGSRDAFFSPLHVNYLDENWNQHSKNIISDKKIYNGKIRAQKNEYDFDDNADEVYENPQQKCQTSRTMYSKSSDIFARKSGSMISIKNVVDANRFLANCSKKKENNYFAAKDLPSFLHQVDTDRSYVTNNNTKRGLNLAPDFNKIYSQVKQNHSITKNLTIDVDHMVSKCTEAKDKLSKELRVEKTRICKIIDTMKEKVCQILENKKKEFFANFDIYEEGIMKLEQQMHSQANKLELLISELGLGLKGGQRFEKEKMDYAEVTKVKIIDGRFNLVESYDERWGCGVNQLDVELQKLVVNSNFKQVLERIGDYPRLYKGSEVEFQGYMDDYYELMESMTDRIDEILTIESIGLGRRKDRGSEFGQDLKAVPTYKIICS